MDRSVLIVVIVLGGASAVLLAGVIALGLSLRRLSKQLVLLQGSDTESDFVSVVSSHVEAARVLQNHMVTVEARVADLRSAIARSVQRVGVVRYDAFEDMGGHLSFSAAFLDEHGTGICLTCINGRTDARMYAKGVMTGRGAEVTLSHEEDAAVRLAMESEHYESAPAQEPA